MKKMFLFFNTMNRYRIVGNIVHISTPRESNKKEHPLSQELFRERASKIFVVWKFLFPEYEYNGKKVSRETFKKELKKYTEKQRLTLKLMNSFDET